MLNLNEKYFTISEPRGRNHQNKFCLRPLKRRFSPWELTPCSRPYIFMKFQFLYHCMMWAQIQIKLKAFRPRFLWMIRTIYAKSILRTCSKNYLLCYRGSHIRLYTLFFIDTHQTATFGFELHMLSQMKTNAYSPMCDPSIQSNAHQPRPVLTVGNVSL